MSLLKADFNANSLPNKTNFRRQIHINLEDSKKLSILILINFENQILKPVMSIANNIL